MDQTKRDRQEELQGDALRAVDYHRAARVIRGWHACLSGTEPLADVNEAFHGTEDTQAWQERLFGEGDIRGNRAALPGILEHFDLYPWRVQLLVEGPSEEQTLKLLIEEYWRSSFGRLGMRSAGADRVLRTPQGLWLTQGKAVPITFPMVFFEWRWRIQLPQGWRSHGRLAT